MLRVARDLSTFSSSTQGNIRTFTFIDRTDILEVDLLIRITRPGKTFCAVYILLRQGFQNSIIILKLLDHYANINRWELVIFRVV